MELFEQLGKALKPEKVVMIIANVKGKKIPHSFYETISKNAIQLFLINKYGSDCWSWE